MKLLYLMFALLVSNTAIGISQEITNDFLPLKGLAAVSVQISINDEDLFSRKGIREEEIRARVELKLRMVGIEIRQNHYDQIKIQLQGLAASEYSTAVYLGVDATRISVIMGQTADRLRQLDGTKLNFMNFIEQVIQDAYNGNVWGRSSLAILGDKVIKSTIVEKIESFMTILVNDYLAQN